MPQSDRLATEYTAFIKQFGYEPAELATSTDEVRRRIAANARTEAERQQRESEFEQFISSLGPAALDGEEMLDPSGYGSFLDDVLASECIATTTTESVYCGEFSNWGVQRER